MQKGSIALCNKDAEIRRVNMEAGILDMKLKNQYLACALSDGTLEIYDIDIEQFLTTSARIEHHDEGFALSVAWNSSNKVAISTQQGSLIVYEHAPSGMVESESMYNSHKLFGENNPAWITTFSSTDDNILLSGGDDCVMNLWDLRDVSKPFYKTNKNIFGSGVTSAQWRPNDSNIFAVGKLLKM